MQKNQKNKKQALNSGIQFWNAVPGLQHAFTLGAAKSLAKKWARDIPR